MGLLLSLFVIAALVSLFQARIVDEKVREQTEVEDPSSAAVYEMEINMITTGMGVLGFTASRSAAGSGKGTFSGESQLTWY